MKARTGLWASLAIAASVGLAGCGGSSDNDDDGMMMTSHACDAGASAACVAARQAELDALGDDDSKADHDAAEQALADAQQAFAELNDMNARTALEDAAKCTAATQACLTAHDNLVAALEADIAALEGDDDATNAQQKEAQDALDAAQASREEVNTALSDMRRDTAIGTAVTNAETEADKLEADRSPEAIQAAKDAIMAAKDEIAKGDDADAFSDEIEAAEGAVARAEARNSIEAAIKAAKDAASGLATDSSVSAVTAAQALIETAKMMVSGNDDHLSEAEETAYNDEIRESAQVPVNVAKADNDAALEKQRMEEEEEQKRLAAAAKKMGEDLYKALGTNVSNATTALANLLANDDSPALSATGFDITIPAGAGIQLGTETRRGEQTLEPKSGTVATLSGWNGMDFAGTSGTGDKKITDEARVYHNQSAPKPELLIRNGGPFNLVNGYLARGGTEDDLVDVSDTERDPPDLERVMSPAFLHQGTQTHSVPEKENGVYVRGTFDGAPGEFRCQSGCSSTNDGEGSPSALGGTWHFKPDENAMVSTPDNTYLYFGWWVSKNSDNEPTAASAFAGTVGGVMGAGTSIVHGWADESAADAITGSATYIGAAVGKYAYKDISGGTAHGGHFTADAELTAKFGDHSPSNNGGVEGTIDDFRLNDGSEDPGWSVKLNKPASNAETWSGNGGIVGGTTVWSINSNAAPAESIAKGTWSGTMYDERPGDAPDGDGSNIPTVVTGTFYSEFGSEGRMVGAFGANHSGN